MSSDPDLVLKLLRKLDSDLQEFRREVDGRFEQVDGRLNRLEHTVAGMATEMFFLSSFIKTIDRRVRKLEDR